MKEASKQLTTDTNDRLQGCWCCWASVTGGQVMWMKIDYGYVNYIQTWIIYKRVWSVRWTYVLGYTSRHLVNSLDLYDFSASTLNNRSIGSDVVGAFLHSGWDSKSRLTWSHSSWAPRSRVNTAYTRRVVRSVKRSQYWTGLRLFLRGCMHPEQSGSPVWVLVLYGPLSGPWMLVALCPGRMLNTRDGVPSHRCGCVLLQWSVLLHSIPSLPGCARTRRTWSYSEVSKNACDQQAFLVTKSD